MYPNQQPQNNGQPTGPAPQPQPQPYAPQPSYPQQPAPAQPQQPGYGPQPTPTYAVDYLDQIAPPPPQQKFFSGSFGKIFLLMIVLLLVGVGVIVASGGKSKTGDLELVTVRLENMQKVAKTEHKYLKSGDLTANNATLQTWFAGNASQGYDLLKQAGVQKNKIDKEITASEKAAAAKLTEEFYEARLNANLDRDYAREMAFQLQLIKTALDKMSKKSEAKAIREYAKSASTNLAPIQKSFADFDDSTDG